MRRRSKKTRDLYAKHRAMREAFVGEMGRCAGCGRHHPGLAAHEMTPGKNRMRAFGRRECLLAACPECNCIHFPDRGEWPLARQLWRKFLTDPAHFDLDVINETLAPDGHPNPPPVVHWSDVMHAAADEHREGSCPL
jgi:hypothetical protein